MSQTSTRPTRPRGVRKDTAVATDGQKSTHAISARTQALQSLADFWLAMTGRSSVCRRSLATVFSYLVEAGEENLTNWIAKAAAKCWSDDSMGKYVSGAMRQHRLQQAEGGEA